MATAQIVPLRPAPSTLYELEDSLQALVDSLDSSEEPSARTQIWQQIEHELRRAREKRDAVVRFLRHCEQQQEFADAEIARIQKRKAFIARVQQELEGKVIEIVEQFATPDRRGIKRLDGNSSSMRIQKNPDSVRIVDPALVPPAFKAAVVTMPAYVWEALLECLRLEDRKEFEALIEKLDYKPKSAPTERNSRVAPRFRGADLAFGDWRLVLS